MKGTRLRIGEQASALTFAGRLALLLNSPGGALRNLPQRAADAMGRAGSRLPERPARLSVGRRRPAGSAHRSSSPPASRFRPASLARAWSASVCALGALAAGVTLLLAAGEAVADSHTVPLTVQTAFTCPNCPAAPAGTAEPGPGAGEITLRWTWSKGTKPAVATWEVFCQAGSDDPRDSRTNLGAGTRKFTCTNLKPGVQYRATVRGRSAALFSTSIMGADLLPEDLVAEAGDDATVYAGARVTLDGTGSATGRSGATLSYAWVQTAGPTVRLDGATSARPSFIAPRVSSQANLTFELMVDDGTSSEKDTVTVTVVPLVTGASVSGTTLSVTFDAALKTSAKPASSAFTVTATKGGASRAIAGTSSLVTFSGKTVTATLSAAVAGDETLRVRYDKPASGAVLEDGTGTALPSFSNWPAGNAGDTTPPTVSSAAINGRTVTLTFNEALDESSVPTLVQFPASIGGQTAGADSIRVAGKVVTLTYPSVARARHGHAVIMDYRNFRATHTPLRDLSQNAVAEFIGRSVTNNTPPAFDSATVNGDALTVTFDGELDPDSVPAADAFTVTVGGAEVELASANPVSISGTAVTLNLAEAVLRVQTVTVGYTAPAVKPLQDADGAKNPVPGFTGKAVTNDTPADTTPPRVSGKAINGTTMTVTFNEALLESSNGIPEANRFSVGVAGSFVTVSNVDVSGSTLTLTLGTAAAHGDEATVSYSHPQGDLCTRCLQDLSANEVRPFRTTPAAPVTNNTPPAFSSAEVNGDALTVTFDGELDPDSVPAADAFTVTVGGTEVELASANPVSISGTAVTLNLAEAVLRVQTVTVGYTAPAVKPLRDEDGANNPVPGFTGKAVTNDTPADTTPPRVSGKAVNGTTLTVTFNEALLESSNGIPDANRFAVGVVGTFVTVSNVDVSGSTLTLTLGTAAAHGDDVTVTYSHPQGDLCTRCLQDLSANEVRPFRTTPAAPVTNNTPPAFSSAEVNGDALTVTFDGELDPDSVPAADAFTVTVGGTEVELAAANPVSIGGPGGKTVTLTLAESVGGSLPTVTVSYAVPAANPLRDEDNAKLPVAGFTGKTVANNTSGDTTPPRVSSAAINGRTVTLTFNEALDESSVPTLVQFPASIGGQTAGADSIRVAGKVVTLTYPSVARARHGHAVIMDYRNFRATHTPLRDLSQNAVAEFIGRSVTNNTPPAFDSATVNGDALTVTFDGELDSGSVPAADAFTVTVGGAEVELAAANPVSIGGPGGKTVTLTLAESVGGSLPTVTVSYAVPAANPLRDEDNAKLPVAGFTGKTVANNTSGDTTPPTVSSAAINGRTVTLTFNEALDESSVPTLVQFPASIGGQTAGADSIRVAGKVVTLTYPSVARARHGHAVIMDYRNFRATHTPLRDLSQNAVAEFIGRSVTNNTPPAFSSAEVNGDALTVTFDGGLDPDSVPAADAFTVTVGGARVALVDGDPVSIGGPGGETVTVTLPVTVNRTQRVRMGYTAPAVNPLRDADRAKLPVAGFTGQSVTNNSPADSTPPVLLSASVNAVTLKLHYDEALSATPLPEAGAFAVAVDGTATALAATNPVSVSGRSVTLTLAAAVTARNAVTVGYTRPTGMGAKPIRDDAGNEAESFADVEVANETPAPLATIASVAIESAPSSGDTYALGERIRVKVTWAADVLWDVSGSGAALSVGLEVGGTARTARFATGSETRGRARALTFGYTVADGDRDEDGIVIVRTAAHDVVALSGGATLKDAQGRDAVRGGTGEFGPAPGHKVDSSKLAPDKAPALVGATVSGKTLTLTFDEDLAAPADPEAASRALRMAFFVQGGRYQGAHVPNQSPTRVAIDGPTVTLILGSGVGAGQAVTVEYGPDGIATHRLRGADGKKKEVESFVNRRVDNATARAGPAPRLARATVEGSTLTLFFDRKLDQNSQPAGRLFSVSGWADGVTYQLRGTGRARISGAVAVVMLDGALPTETVKNDKGEDVEAPDGSPAVRYVRRWSEPALRGADGAVVADIASWLARGLDGTGPAAAVGTVSGTKVTLYYDEALDERYVPLPAAFTVTLPGNKTPAVQTVAVRGNAVFLTLAPGDSIDHRLIVGVRYTASAAGAGRLRDMAGNEARDHPVIIPLDRNLGTGEPEGKPALAETNPAVVDGDRLKLTFDQALDTSKVPRVEAFTLTVGWYAGFDDVKVNGPEVILRLIGAMHPCEGAELNADGNIVPNDDIKLNYVTPSRNALGNRLGTQADNIVRAVVRNARANNEHCDEDGLEGAYRNSIILRGKRPFAQVAPPRAAWFTVTASGGPVTVTGAAFSPDDPYELKLTLSRDLGPDETATVSYRRPAGARGLWNVDGQQLFDVVDLPVRMRAQDGAPAVEAVALVSDPGTDRTYTAGDEIRVRVTFGAAVTVDTAQGTPRLKLDLGGEEGSGERWAAYASGSGEAALIFAYTAVAGDASTGGVAVVADTLEANGGTLRSAAGADAALAHAGLNPDAGHKVDTDPPGFASAAVNGATLTVTFDEDLDAGSAPVGSAFTVTAAPPEGDARAIAGTGTTGVAGAAVTVTLAGAVLHGETLSVAYAPPEQSPVRDLAGNAAAAFAGESAENGTGAPAPAVEAVALVSDPGTDATYAAGDTIGIRVTFGAPVTVDTAQGTPHLKLELGGEAGERWAAYASGSGTNELTFAYTAVAGDASAGGVAVVADTLELDGGTIVSAAGAAAALAHAGLNADPAHRVDANPPGFASAAVDGATLTVTFDEDLDAGSASAASAFTVTAAPADGEARAIAGTGTANVAGAAVTVTLAGAVAHGETLTVAYAPPDENPVRDLAGNAAAAFSGEAAENGTAAPAPAVEALALVSEPGADATYAAGDAIRVQLTFGAPVTVDTAQGSPRLKLDLGGEEGSGERWAAYASGSGTNTLAFSYEAVSGDASTGGVAVLADTLQANGGTLRSAAGAAAALTHAGLEPDPAHRVDANPPAFASAAVDGATLTVTFDEALDEAVAPAGSAFTVTAVAADGEARAIAGTGTTGVAGAAVTVTLAGAVAHGEMLTVAYAPPDDGGLRDRAGNAPAAFSGEAAENGTGAPAPAVEAVALVSDPGTDATYAAGDAIRVQVTFGAPVTVDTAQGTPRLKLDLGGEEGSGERWAAYASGSGEAALTFTYTAVAGDASAGGVAVVADTLELDGGTIVSAAGADAALTHAGLEPDPAHRVDANPPAFASAAVDGATLTVTFDEDLDEGSAPAGSAFTVTAAPPEGDARAIAGTGTAGVAGAAVTVTLAGAVAHGETLTVAYAPPQDDRLRDVAGNEVVTFSGKAAENGTPAPAEPPSVEAVAVVSDPGADATYAAGDVIRVRVTFGEAVAVDTAGGVPRLKIDMDPADWGDKWAAYDGGSGTTALAFVYRARKPNTSTQGIAVLADTLEANGGTIRSAATGMDAQLSHLGLHHDPAHKVDTTAPLLTRVTTLDGVTLTLAFDEALDTGSVPAAGAFAFSGAASATSVTGVAFKSGDATRIELTVSPAIVPPPPGSGGRGLTVVTYTPPAAEGAARLRDVAGNKVVTFRRSVTNIAPPRPTAATVIGKTLTVSFDRFLSRKGAHWPAAEAWTLSVNGAGRAVTGGVIRGKRTDVALTLASAVAHGDAVTLGYNGTRLRDVEGRAVAPFSLTVTNETPAAPSVAAVAVTSRPASGDTYALGETIRVTVTFNKAVTVDTTGGTPRLKIKMDPTWGEFWAAYDSGSGSAALTFAHQVAEPNTSPRGIAVLANTLEANGGTIRAAGTSVDSDLAHAGLDHDPAHKVDWRPALSVADAEANEGQDAAITFAVTLSRPASATVTVDYATADGTATAGEDYTATSGTLTFAAGESSKTIAVPLLDDAIDEGRETFALRLSNAQGARIADGEATGTIINSDKMPQAWTARFGRAVAVHVVDAVEQRLEQAPSESWAELGGHRLGGGPAVQETVQRLAPDRDLWAEAEAAATPGQDMTPAQLLLGSAFHLVSNPENQARGPRLSAWGRVASSVFDGREDKLSLDGTVTTATLGVDGIWKRWLTGLLLAYSEGDGSFTHANLPGGDVSSSLTSLHPYVAYTLSDRVRLWGLVGYGSGALRLELEDERAMDTDLTMSMGALGVRGALLQPSNPSGLELALRSDVLWMVMDSAAADNLAATEAETSRLRLVLEGSRPVALAGGGMFTPSLELGLRHDGGDAETGTGLEVGGSLRYASAWGLSIEASLRALVAHEAQDYTEWGASGALRFDPGRQGKGFTASVVPAWGTAASGVERLWGQSGATGLVPADALATAAAGRLEAELGYGLAALKGRGLLTPYARVALTEGADQAWHLGTRLALAESLSLSVEASRRQRQGDVEAHELALRANLGF